MTRKKTHHSRTRLVHGRQKTEAWEFSHHMIPPITAATTFRLDSLERGAQGFVDFASADFPQAQSPILIYDRLDEPNAMMLEESLALMESAESAVSFGSGMGAISSALLSVLKSGRRVIAHRTLYGCSYSLLTQWLPRFGIDTAFIDINDPRQRNAFSDPAVKVVYFESLSNPSLELADLPAVLKDVRDANAGRKPEDRIVTIVDNTFATPWALRPLEHGIDMVVQSLTKNISGFGTEMGGAVLCSKKLEQGLKLARKDFGATLNPKAAWSVLVHGVPTLPLRFEQQQKSARAISEFLEKHPRIESVTYPGLKSYPQSRLARRLLRTPEGAFAPGTMISFIVKGDMRRCRKFVDRIAKHSYTITLAVSLGTTKTLIEVPGFMTHATIPREKQKESGLDPRSIRLSLGIENAEDIIADLSAALERL